MRSTVETVLVGVAALPALYGLGCWLRRFANARKTARWVQQAQPEEWNALHWLARRNQWAGVQVLITKGRISGPEIDAFRVRDEHLEKATWLGMLLSAVLLLAIVIAEELVRRL
jgi:hypothetical protein